MNKEIFVKCLLCEYPKIELIANKLEKVINKTSFEAAYNEFELNFLNYFNLIVGLLERKKNLVNLKVIMDKSLLKIDEDLCKILCLRYFDNFKIEDICQVLNISSSQFFRKHKIAVSRFANQMISEGLDQKMAKDLFENEGWLRRKYHEIESGFVAENIVLSNKKSCNECARQMA